MIELKDKRLFLLDMDGTIYLGDKLFEGTKDFLKLIKKMGGRYLFLTNNSSRSVESYVEKLSKLGIEAAQSDFYTSVDATIKYLSSLHAYKKIYAFGTASFKQQLRKSGLSVTDRLSDDIDCLLMGFDTELTFSKLEDACILLGRGLDYIATNPDWVCPTSYGYVPDCGSVAEMLKRATGRSPRFIGKPQPDMVLSAISITGYKPEETLVIGDRLYTDIACGVNAGVDTVLVLSGESKLSDIGDIKPTYTLENIKELYDKLKFYLL
jgi:HAD superfamily hydrolase (TIGR01457 family)